MKKEQVNLTLTEDSAEAQSFCQKIAETIKTDEGRRYLSARASQLPKISLTVKEALKKYAEQAMRVLGMQEGDGSWWSGKELKQTETLPAAVETRLGEAATALQRYGREINIHYAVDSYQKGTRFALQYLSPEGELLPPAITKDLEALVAGWMQEQSIVNKGGGIYEANKQDGKALRDNHGREIDVSSIRFEQILTDERQGLQATLKARGVSTTIAAITEPTTPIAERKVEEAPSRDRKMTEEKVVTPTASENPESVTVPDQKQL